MSTAIRPFTVSLALLLLALIGAQAGCSTVPVSDDDTPAASVNRSPLPIEGNLSRKERIRIFTAIEGL